MKPGATTRPSASIVRDAESRSLPSATILPLRTATSPRFDVGPHLRQGIQGRDERLHLLRGVGYEEGLNRAQPAPEPDLAQDGLEALGHAVNLGQQDELRLVVIRQGERPRNGGALLRRHGPLPPLDERDLVRTNGAVSA